MGSRSRKYWYSFFMLAAIVFMVSFLSNNAAATYDMDNDFYQATEISILEPAFGSVDSSDDISDFYKIYMEAGESLDLTLEITSPADLGLWIYDDNGPFSVIFAYSDRPNLATGIFTEHIQVTAWYSGWYFIEVTCFDEAGDYKLLVRTVAEWTVMVYLDADNNLEDAGIEDFLEMASVGSDPGLNILVQMDRFDGTEYVAGSWLYDPDIDDTSYGNWTETMRFRVTEGMAPTEANAVQDLGEVDMGSPNSLYDFLSWGQAYPAHHYMVVLWDHGGNWHGVCWDDYDYPANYLSMAELNSAFASYHSDYPEFMCDIIGFDACIMAGAEVYEEIAPYCDYIIGSEINEPGPGWNYELFLSGLVSNLFTEPQALACNVVDTYIASYETAIPPYYNYDVTLSVFDASQMNELSLAISNLVDALSDRLPVLHNYYSMCREVTESYDSGRFVDLLDLATMMHLYIPDADIKQRALELMTLLEDAIVLSGVFDTEYADVLDMASGLTIYFPAEGPNYDDRYGDATLHFTQNTLWDQFLEDLYAYEAVPNEPTAIIEWSPANDLTVEAGTSVNFTITVDNPDSDQLQYSWVIDGTTQYNYTSNSMSFWTNPAVGGTYYVTAFVFDGADWARHDWTVHVLGPANLIITGYYLTDPEGNVVTEVTSGQEFYVYATVMNIGESSAPAFFVDCYLDSVPVCYWDLSSGLAAGSDQPMQSMPIYVSDPGAHIITFVVDPTSAVIEANETDNDGGFQIDIVQAEWTILVYMDGDNNLEPYMINNFLEMAEVGTDVSVNIVVQFDRSGGYDSRYGDWTGCNRYLVRAGDEPTGAGALMALGEVNMGDDSTLTSFLLWGSGRFQAQNYMVVLKDHGASWMGCCYDDTSGGDQLDLWEIQNSIAVLNAEIGQTTNIILFDDCLMGSIEVATQMDGLARYAVVSETIGWTSNIDYAVVFDALCSEPTMTANAFALFIGASEHLVDSEEYVTQSGAVYDLSKVVQLKAAFDLYTTELSRCFNETPGNVQLSRFISDYMEFLGGGPGQEIIDLYQFVESSMTCCDDEQLSVRAQALLDLLTPEGSADSIMLLCRTTESASFCHGMSIYFPVDADRYDLSYLTSGWFGSSSSWNYFLPRFIFDGPLYTVIEVEGTEGVGGWYKSAVNVTLSTFDLSGEGVSWLRYSLDGGAWTDYAGKITVSSPGEHSLSIQSMGVNGVLEDVKTIAFKVDSIAPSVVASVVGNLLNLTASDATSGVTSVHYRIDGGEWLDYTIPVEITPLGWEHLVEYYAVDGAGNPSAVDQTSVGQDDGAFPVSSVLLSGDEGDNGWYVGQVSLTMSATDAGGSGLKQINYRLDGGDWQLYDGAIMFSDEGTYVVEYYAQDHFGNLEAVRSIVIKIDLMAPQASAETNGPGNNGWYNGTVTVTIEATDALSGVSSIKYRISGQSWSVYTNAIELSAEGDNLIEWYATDLAGHVGETQSATVRIDATDPTVSMTVPPASEGWINSSAEVVIGASDSGSGVDRIMYRLNGNEWVLAPSQATSLTFALPEGEYLLECRSLDNAGNTCAMGTASLKVDGTAPVTHLVISGVQGDDGSYLVNASLTMQCTEGHSGLDQTYYRLNGGEWTLFDGAVLITMAGQCSVQYYSVDNSGNIEEVRNASLKVVQATIPGPVTDLDFRESNGTILVTWDLANDGGTNLTGFNVYRSVDGGALQLVGTVHESEYTDADVEPGRAYRYSVVAVNPLGAGLASAEIEAKLASAGGIDATIIVVAVVATIALASVILWVRKR